MKERIFYQPKSTKAAQIVAVFLIGCVVLNMAYTSGLKLSKNHLQRGDIIYVVLMAAFSLAFVLAAVPAIRAIRYKGPILVISNTGIELLPEKQIFE